MARIRTIKPEFFTSDDICALSPLARLLYVGLWCEADRDGRLVWTPGVMKRRYLPDDACDIEVLGAELVGRGLIRLYGDGLACIPSFARHQHVNIREAQSKLPPPPGEIQAQLPLGREGEGKEREGEGTGDGGAHAHVLPQDWKPDDGDLAWAATARPDLDGTALDAESERFRNHAAANRRGECPRGVFPVRLCRGRRTSVRRFRQHPLPRGVGFPTARHHHPGGSGV